MAAVSDPGPNSGSTDPYSRLGLSPGASFEEVQSARQRCLTLAGDDSQEQAKVEAAYDAVLMGRLRDRQGGQISQAAASASAREDSISEASVKAPSPSVGVLQRFRSSLPDPSQSFKTLAPEWSLVEGQGLVVRLLAGAVLLFLLIFSVNSVQLVLSLAVIGCFISNSRRGRRALPALGWSLLPLLVGVVLGGIITALLADPLASQSFLTTDQLQSLPALLLLWVVALFLL